MKSHGLWPIPFPAVVAVALGCAGFALTLVVDPDVFWHVRTGQWIVEHGALPATDPFLQTQGATPWVLHEWLFEVIMVAPYRWWGLEGLRILGALALVIVYLSLYRTGRSQLGGFAATVAAVAIANIALPSFVARPQIASYCLFVPVLAAIIMHYDSGRWQPLVWIPPAMVLWANLHAGYMIGLGVLLVATVAAAIDWILVPRARGLPQERSPMPLAACFLASVLAAAINPYGFAHLAYPFKTMSMWMLPLIDEWQRPAWQTAHSRVLLALILAFVLFQQYRKQPSPVFDWAIAFALVFLALQASRHAPFAAFAIGMLLMLRWHLRPDWLHSPAVVRDQLRRVVGRGQPGAPGRARRELGRTSTGLLHAGLIAMMLALTPSLSGRALQYQRAKMAPTCGIDAVDYVKRQGLAGPGLNDYAFGGYMTYVLWPGQKAFVDGRPDMYSDAFAKEYMMMVFGGPDWRRVFDRYGFNYVVMPRAAPIVQLLLATGTFEQVYADSHNVVLARRTER